MSAPLFSWFLAFAVHGVEGALCLVVIRMRGVLGSLPRARVFPLMSLGTTLPRAGVPLAEMRGVLTTLEAGEACDGVCPPVLGTGEATLGCGGP